MTTADTPADIPELFLQVNTRMTADQFAEFEAFFHGGGTPHHRTQGE